MALAKKTFDQIRDEYLVDIRNTITGARTQPGSDFFAKGSALASALLPLYANGQYLADQALPITASEATLHVFARKTSTPKKGAQYASGSITVTSSFVTSIPDGSVLTNQSTGAQYKTVGTTSIGSSLTAIANVISVAAGVAHNATIGTALVFNSAPAGVNPFATVNSITGGDSEWSNVRWANEIIKRMRAKPAAGNEAHLRALADTVSGVEQAFVFPCLRGSGTCDVVITTPASSGTRVASTELLARVAGAFMIGAQENGEFIAPISESCFANMRIHAAVEEPTVVTIVFKASKQNPFSAWPPYGDDYIQHDDENTWWTVTSSTDASNFIVAEPSVGIVVPPSVGFDFGAFFPSKGFCKGTIVSVSGSGPYTLGVTWTPQPSESDIATGTVLTPWCSQLPQIAGPPTTETGRALSGAVPEYFARLGVGQMTSLTDDDITRRCRWPQVGDVSPFDGEAFFPTDVTARLSLKSFTDAVDFAVSANPSTPSVPDAAFIGTPPSILVVSTIRLLPRV